MNAILERLQRWAKALKKQTMVLWFCYHHPGTPWLPRWIAILVVAYALSPIDLIPDFIPVLGYLDDLIILPLGIWLAIHLMPPLVLAACQTKAAEWEQQHSKRPPNRVAALVIMLLWVLLLIGTWVVYVRDA
ncbi:YkvA family protein [Pseudomonas sp.]|uniref:YkvA family protein n=1 Tax=Pseudomonas sp. TaxID=306 RepID=UPI003D6DC1F2